MPYNTILKSILFGRGTRDYSIVSPTAPEYTPAWSIYTTNLAKAKALMKAAGSPKINEPLYYLSSDVDQTNTAILIQASLKSIGITTTLTPETQAGLFNVVDARSTPANGAQIGPPGLELFNWSAWTDDPKIVIGYWATTGGINNYSLWSNPTVDALQQQVRVARHVCREDGGIQGGADHNRRGSARHPDRSHRDCRGHNCWGNWGVFLTRRLRALLAHAPDRDDQPARQHGWLMG